jgi:putative inorganic carbon (HCO3(-)) transporter
MPGDFEELHFDAAVIMVWGGLLFIGLIAWSFSGTPVAGACVVLAVLLAIASPSGALYATCAAIPLVFHPIEIGSLSLSLLEIGVLATVAGTAIRMAFDFVESSRLPELQSLGRPPTWILPGLLLLVGTLSLAWMPYGLHRAEALRTWRWVIFEPLLVFVLARLAIRRDGGGPLAVAITVPAGVVAMVAIWQLGSASSGFSADDVQRSTATYLHPNNLAFYLERAAMLSLIPALLLKSRFRWWFSGLTVILILGLAATFSRGALLGLAAGCAVVLLARPIRHGWRMLGVGAMATIAAFALVARDRFSGADSSGFVETRRLLWEGSGRMLRDFPITGIGLDQFLWLNQSRYIDPQIWSERYTSHPHNLLLDSWLSLGLPGLGLLFGLVLAGGWIIWRSRTGRVMLSPWQLGALGCLGAGLGHGMVDNGYMLADLSVMTWLAIALLLGVAPESATVSHD